MYVIISDILLIVGVCVFFVKRQLAPFYFIIWCMMGSYFVDCFVAPLSEEGDFHLIYSRAYLYVLFCCLVVAIRDMRLFLKINGKNLVIYLLYMAYVIVLGLIRGGEVKDFLGYVRLATMSFVLWMWLRVVNIENVYFERFVTISLIIEICLSISQYLGIGHILSYDSEYNDVGTFNAPGTLTRYNPFAMHVSLLLLCYCTIRFLKRQLKKMISLGIILPSFVLVFISGAKAQLAALLISTMYLMAYYNRKHIYGIIAGVLIVAGGFIYMAKTINTGALDKESGMERQANLLRISSEKNYVEEESTVMLSFFLLDDYFSDISNILTGSGKLYTRKDGYGGFITADSGNTTDAPLVLYLCETGLIGVFFIIVFIRKMTKDIKYYKQFSYAILLCVLLTTVTDIGIFDEINMFYFVTIVLYLNNVARNNLSCIDNAPLLNS